MPGGRRKVSFVLQFTETGDPAESAQWRGALQEVESGQRQAFTTYENLIGGLAQHGIRLTDSEGRSCPSCGETITMPWEQN